MMHAVRANSAVRLFTRELLHSGHEFYFNRSFRKSAMKNTRGHE